MIIPSMFPADREHEKAEKKVYEALYSLSNKYDIFYHRKFSPVYKPMFEVDFIICDRRKSILVMEVKGGQMQYKDGIWWSYSEPAEKNPEDQVVDAKHKFLAHYNLEDAIWVDHCLAFPDYELRNRPDTLFEYQVLDQFAFYDLEAALLHAFKESQKRKPVFYVPLIDHRYNKLVSDITGTVTQTIPLPRKLALEENRVLELTESQYLIYECCAENKRLLIDGVAGSGKTLLASKIAKDSYKEGKNVLLLCYNKMLGRTFENEIHTTVGTDNPNIFRGGACHEYLKENYLGELYDNEEALPRGEKRQEFYTQLVPMALTDLISSGAVQQKYDVIVIDEAQDFNEWQMEAIYGLLKQEGQIVLLKDDQQTIFAANTLPERDSFFKIRLNRNLRNTKAIIRFINSTLGLQMEINPENPDGERVEVLPIKDNRELFTNLENKVRLLYHELKRTEDIIILVPERWDESHCLFGRTEIHQFVLKEMPDSIQQEPGTIYYTRISKFKGLEAPCLLIPHFELFRPTDEKRRRYLYTALTRARNRLFLWEKV